MQTVMAEGKTSIAFLPMYVGYYRVTGEESATYPIDRDRSSKDRAVRAVKLNFILIFL